MTADENTREVIDICANALAAAALLAVKLRREIGTANDDAVNLEAAVDRAVRAIKRLHPEEGAQ
jgi:hypothetical protein